MLQKVAEVATLSHFMLVISFFSFPNNNVEMLSFVIRDLSQGIFQIKARNC